MDAPRIPRLASRAACPEPINLRSADSQHEDTFGQLRNTGSLVECFQLGCFRRSPSSLAQVRHADIGTHAKPIRTPLVLGASELRGRGLVETRAQTSVPRRVNWFVAVKEEVVPNVPARWCRLTPSFQP